MSYITYRKLRELILKLTEENNMEASCEWECTWDDILDDGELRANVVTYELMGKVQNIKKYGYARIYPLVKKFDDEYDLMEYFDFCDFAEPEEEYDDDVNPGYYEQLQEYFKHPFTYFG